MQTQVERDEKTLVIVTAIGVFVVALALGCATLWLAHLAFDLSESSLDVGGRLILGGAALLGLGVLVREVRRDLHVHGD